MKKAMYPRNNFQVRIVHVGNDNWRRQEIGNQKGDKELDPWHNMSPILTREEAEASLNRFHLAPPKK